MPGPWHQTSGPYSYRPRSLVVAPTGDAYLAVSFGLLLRRYSTPHQWQLLQTVLSPATSRYWQCNPYITNSEINSFFFAFSGAFPPKL